MLQPPGFPLPYSPCPTPAHCGEHISQTNIHLGRCQGTRQVLDAWRKNGKEDGGGVWRGLKADAGDLSSPSPQADV